MSWFHKICPSPWGEPRGSVDHRLAFQEGRRHGAEGGDLPPEIEDARWDISRVDARSYYNGWLSGRAIHRRRHGAPRVVAELHPPPLQAPPPREDVLPEEKIPEEQPRLAIAKRVGRWTRVMQRDFSRGYRAGLKGLKQVLRPKYRHVWGQGYAAGKRKRKENDS